MLDRKIVVVAVVALVVGLLLGYVVGYFGTNVSSLTQRIGSLESQVDDLNSQLDTANSELNSTNLRIGQLNSLMAQKNASISSLNSQSANLNQQIATLQAQKTVLTQQINSLQATVTRLNGQLKTQVLGVYFSPNGGCEDQILYWIDRANSSIEILIYSFTLDSVGDALVEAHGRGVEVQVVFEVSQISQSSEYKKLKDAGIEVRNDTNSGDMHDKVMIVDGVIVLTGSFNYSNAAEKTNNENLLVINSTTIATIYGQEFTRIWDVSKAEEETPYQTTFVEITSVYAISEYVVIENKGDEAVSMASWTLSDIAGHIFYFPSFVLGAGKTVTVHTGDGTNTETDLYWGRGDTVWNNDHDTAYLHNQMGELVDQTSW